MNNTSKFTLLAIIALSLFVGLPIYLYWQQFKVESQTLNLSAWSNFSSFFNSISSPIIAGLNLVLFIFISFKVSGLQERVTINQMRNERYQAIVTSFNNFIADYEIADSNDGKLHLISGFSKQIDLYPNRMNHLFTFEDNDQDILNLKSSLSTLVEKVKVVKSQNTPSAKSEELTQFQNVVALTEVFLTKLQMLILKSIKG